jgi:hypothetical protein
MADYIKLLDTAQRLSKRNPLAKRAFKRFEKLGDKAANWTENQVRALEKHVKTYLNSADKAKLSARSKPFVQNTSGAARSVPKSKLQSKMDKAKTGNDVAAQGSREVATQGSRAVTTQGSRAVAKRPGSAVTTQGSRAASSDKGKIIGLSNKAKIGLGAAAAAGAAAGYAGFGGEDKQSKADKPLSKLQTRTIAKRKEPVPVVDDTPRPKSEPIAPAVSSGSSSSSKSSDGETIGEYFSNLKGRKTKVKTPFGTIDVDSSDAAYNMEPEFSGDYKGGRPGMKKNAVRRNAGGTVGRGMGKALRGGGKVMR